MARNRIPRDPDDALTYCSLALVQESPFELQTQMGCGLPTWTTDTFSTSFLSEVNQLRKMHSVTTSPKGSVARSLAACRQTSTLL